MAVSKVKVTITYCAECGYEPQTLALADALMRTFAHDISSIELIPWYQGSFEVSVGGELVPGAMLAQETTSVSDEAEATNLPTLIEVRPS